MRAKNNGFNFLHGTAINLKEKGVSKPPGQLQAAPLAPALRGEGRVPLLPPSPDHRAGVGDMALAPALGATGLSRMLVLG